MRANDRGHPVEGETVQRDRSSPVGINTDEPALVCAELLAAEVHWAEFDLGELTESSITQQSEVSSCAGTSSRTNRPNPRTEESTTARTSPIAIAPVFRDQQAVRGGARVFGSVGPGASGGITAGGGASETASAATGTATVGVATILAARYWQSTHPSSS